MKTDDVPISIKVNQLKVAVLICETTGWKRSKAHTCEPMQTITLLQTKTDQREGFDVRGFFYFIQYYFYLLLFFFFFLISAVEMRCVP